PTFQELIDSYCTYFLLKKELYQLQGICISAPGAVNATTGIIEGASALPFIHGPNWKKAFLDKLNIEIEIENDANCAALAELYYGAFNDVNDLVYIVIGSGIGGAILKNRVIHQGHHLQGGEFGFSILKYENNEMYSWSQLASTINLVKQVEQITNLKNLSGEEVFNLALNNEQVQSIIEEFYTYNAIGLFNVQYALDPQVILLGGAITQRSDFINELNKKLDVINTRSDGKLKPQLAIGTFGKDANLVGALVNYQLKRNLL
ncbi:MAG: ROK family protein, partial [Bacilli bacterium]